MRVGTAILIVMIGAPAAAQQHAGSMTPTDLEAGAKLYNAQCAGCHGPGGSQVTGVDLARGNFRSGASDEALARTIVDGIPGTAMRAHRFTPQEISVLIAYVRSMSTAAASPTAFVFGGNVVIGRTIVEGKGRCLTCHRIYGSGARRATDLSDVGTTRTPDVLHGALTSAPTVVSAGTRFVRAVTADGTVISGRRLNEDSFTVQLLDDQDRLVSLRKSELREYWVSTALKESPHTVTLTDDERRDVISYLMTLKGVDAIPARGGRP